MTEEFLASHELEVKKLSLGSNGAIKQAARARVGGLAVATVALELELGLLAAVRPRDAALPERHWYLLRPANTRARPPVEQFVESSAARRASRFSGGHNSVGAQNRFRPGGVERVARPD